MNLLKIISSLFKSTSSREGFDNTGDLRKQNWDIRFNDLGIFNYNELGFEIDLKDGFHSISWTDIERLQAYKADLMTTDEICMNIVFNNKTITITEGTKGWYQFIDKVKSALPSFNVNWEALVLETPFEYNLSSIYEREDRIMPLKANFYSIITGKSTAAINYIFQKRGWNIRKTSFTDFELENSWTDLITAPENSNLLLHGLVSYHPENVRIILQIFEDLDCTYKIEFYDNDNQIIEQYQNGV